MELPTNIIEPTVFEPRVIQIYAAQKTGKTDNTLELTRLLAPKALLIDLNDGAGSYRGVYKTIDKRKNVWRRLAELDELLATIQSNKYPYTLGILDNTTDLEEMCEWHATEQYMKSTGGKNWNKFEMTDSGKEFKYYSCVDGTPCKTIAVAGAVKPRELWESVLKIGQGYGYPYLRDSFSYWYERIVTSFEYVILISHIKEKLQEVNREMVTTSDIDLTGKNKTTTARKVDAVGVFTVKGNERFISFKVNDNSGGAGGRFAYLRDQEVLISRLEPDNTINYFWQNVYPTLLLQK